MISRREEDLNQIAGDITPTQEDQTLKGYHLEAQELENRCKLLFYILSISPPLIFTCTIPSVDKA
jgi:hypothetical protein